MVDVFTGRVAVIGLGYIGLPTAVVLATRGIEVIGVDTNPRTIEAIERGEVPFVEPDLAVAVSGAVSMGRLKATLETPEADAFIVAVPTPFNDDHTADLSYIRAAVAADIRSKRPDMLFLGITSPKKEIFFATHGASLGVPVLHGVGGSFDVLSGVTRRAPERWRRLGLEWAFRLVQEPRRLWRRYLVTNSAFIALLARDLVRPTPPYTRSESTHG